MFEPFLLNSLMPVESLFSFSRAIGSGEIVFKSLASQGRVQMDKLIAAIEQKKPQSGESSTPSTSPSKPSPESSPAKPQDELSVKLPQSGSQTESSNLQEAGGSNSQPLTTITPAGEGSPGSSGESVPVSEQ